MDDLISRQAAIDQLHQSYNLLDAEQRLEDLPSAQSHWTPCDWCKYNPPSSMDGKPCTICPAVGRGESDEDGNMECPFCGNTCGFGNYCNEYGADMRGESDV